MSRAAAVAGLLGLAACQAAAQVDDDSAAAALAGLEQRLADAATVAFDFEVTSTGAFESRLTGRVVLDGSDVRLQAGGTFGAQPVQLSLVQAGDRLSGGNGEAGFDQPAPAATREAVLVGLIRMGILHNLAQLSGGQPPDRANGGAAEWVTLHDVRWREPAGDDRRGVAFNIRVSGHDSGSATLWLADDGTPVLREQSVRFPGGEMNVVERYAEFRVEPGVP